MMMRFLGKVLLFCICALLWACSYQHAEEQVLDYHANGVKKTSVWVFPDGEILKRNEWYNNGIKEFEIPYKNNEPHGDFKRWTAYGDVVLTGSYKKGKRHGEWTSYYVENLNSRKKEAVRYYEDDHPVGDWMGWHYNGTKSFEEHYSDKGERVGLWKKWNENGTLVQEDACHLGTEKGYFKRYGNDCKILEYNDCVFGIKEGIYKLYYESFGAPDTSAESCNTAKLREEGVIEHDDAMLPSVLYRADGSIIKKVEYTLCEGCETHQRSREQWFDEQGNLLRESIYEHFSQKGSDGVAYGLCDGDARLFCAETSFVASSSPNGSLDSSALSQKGDFEQSIGRYKASIRYIKSDHKLLYEEYWEVDKKESRSFYPDSLGGKIASEGFWKNGKRDGIWRNWYSSGILRDSLSYVGGERVGEQFSYDSTGKLTIHKTEAGKNRPVIMHLIQ